MYLKLGDKSIGANNIQRCDTKYSKWRKWQKWKVVTGTKRDSK